jgi:hypothetical protein
MTYQFFRETPLRYGLGACQQSVPVHEAANRVAPLPRMRITTERKVPDRSAGTCSRRSTASPCRAAESASRRASWATAHAHSCGPRPAESSRSTLIDAARRRPSCR